MKEELTMRGEYNPSEWYHRMDVVTNGKRAFLVLLSNKGHDLNDTKYFMAIASAEGINGKDGLSAYDLAVKFEGFQGSVTDWLDSLKGGGSGDDSGVSLKIDKSQIATIKKPSDYSEGFSYELKQLRLLVPNNGLSSQYALLSTKSVREGSNVYSFQTAVALDADHSYTWYRVGNSATNKWSTWDLDTVFGDATGENGGGSGTGTPTIPILTAIGWDKITGKPDLVTQNELDTAKADLQKKIDDIPKSSGESGASIKIDKTNTEMVKAPSQYTDGLSYEVKLLKKLLPDTNVKGTYVLLSTKALQQNGKVYCVQTAKTLDSDHQYTWYRSGNSGDDKWTNWDLNTVFPDDSTSSGDDLSKKISWSDITGVPDFITAAALKKVTQELASKADITAAAKGFATKSEVSSLKSDLQEKINAIPKSNGQTGGSIAVDKSSLDTVKVPSKYDDGLSYEVKSLKKVLPNEKVVGTYVLLSTKTAKQGDTTYCIQSAETLDSNHHYTWYRSGSSSDDKWSPWELNTVFPKEAE